MRGDTNLVELLTLQERRYNKALEAADLAALAGHLDVSEAERLIVELVGEQLASDPDAN